MSSSIWVEDFRPRKVEDCILPERIKAQFRKMIEDNNVQNYSAIGSAGSGKTSSARALCEELNLEYMIINMSNESGIDTVRTKVVNFASSLSFRSNYKVIILDEFDYANRNSAQPALRGIIEEFAQNCRFILTGNYGNKIIDPLYSRCPPIDFNFTNEERLEMLKQFISRVREILNSENIAYDLRELADFCKESFPDFRRTLNVLQMNSKDGELKFSSLGSESTKKIDEIVSILSAKEFNFDACRTWVTQNVQANDGHLIRRAFYNRVKEFVKPEFLPAAVLTINQYDFKEASVVDKEINFVAFLIEFAMNVEFKGN